MLVQQVAKMGVLCGTTARVARIVGGCLLPKFQNKPLLAFDIGGTFWSVVGETNI